MSFLNNLSQEAQSCKYSYKVISCWKMFYNCFFHLDENKMNYSANKFARKLFVMSDTTERLHFHFSLSCIGEGNGNPLQCSCLENPRDGGAWWASVCGIAQNRTRLKQLSSSSPICDVLSDSWVHLSFLLLLLTFLWISSFIWTEVLFIKEC